MAKGKMKLPEKTNEDDKVKVSKLKEYYDRAISEYADKHEVMDILDLTDDGKLWEALNASFPSYQILPHTNHTNYLKEYIKSSIYTVSKGADLLPTSEEDKEMVKRINIALEYNWNRANIKHLQLLAGDSAALKNIGITQIGWDSGKQSADGRYKGEIVGSNINAKKFLRDPFAKDLDTSEYCFIKEYYHETYFMGDDRYVEAFKDYKANNSLGLPDYNVMTVERKYASANDGYHTLAIFWVKVSDGKGGTRIDEIHTIGGEHILHYKKGIKPNIFPFAILYCNDPKDDLVGTSVPQRNFANSVASNVLDSIMATSVYKNQRPPKILDTASNINVSAFIEHANDADYTFLAQGDPTKAVNYLKYPQIEREAFNLSGKFERGIEQNSGIDQRYTGKDTGSIMTTGGMQQQIERVTVIDTPKIANYENYTKRLTRLILANLIEFGGKRKYFVKSKTEPNAYDTVEIDDLSNKLENGAAYDYEVSISSLLPKNRARMAEAATQLMEKQMQYTKAGLEVDLMTPEEWLYYQDMPMKEMLLERMGVQRARNAMEDVTEVLYGFGGLTKQGVPPEEALAMTAKRYKDKVAGKRTGQEPGSPSVDPMEEAGGGSLPQGSLPGTE